MKRKPKNLPPSNTHCAGCKKSASDCKDKKVQRVTGKGIDGYYCDDCKRGLV